MSQDFLISSRVQSRRWSPVFRAHVSKCVYVYLCLHMGLLAQMETTCHSSKDKAATFDYYHYSTRKETDLNVPQ